MRRVLLAAFALALALGCESATKIVPQGAQIVLHVDTDAPLPAANGAAPGIDDPIPLFDRLRIELFAPGSTTPCEDCTNEFAIDADKVRTGATVGLAPPPNAPTDKPYRARVRMFQAALARSDGTPDPDAIVETTIALPSVPDETRVDVTVVLHTADVGTPIGTLDAPVPPLPGAPASSLVGTWAPAKRVPCASAPRPGEVCLPGGAFWLGGWRGPWGSIPAHDTFRPRIAVMSPYFMRSLEITSGEVRAQDPALMTDYWTGSDTGDGIYDYCTFAKDAGGPRDVLPVTCVKWASAKKYCAAIDSELPSEAQYEYAAGGMFGRSFPWGEDVPACEDAVYSRLGYGLFAQGVVLCKPAVAPGGPLMGKQGVRDRVDLPTGTVFDLAGNVAEWSRDVWNRSDEGCWSRPGVYVDPVCDAARSVEGQLRPIRGGDWLITGGQLRRYVRSAAAALGFVSPEVGFRCTRSAAP